MRGYKLLDNALIAECKKANPRLCYAVKIAYPNYTILAHTGVGDLVINGEVYTGLGMLSKIESVKQDAQIGPNALMLGLNGLESGLIAEVLNDRCNGSKVWLYLVALDDDDRAASAANLYVGRIVSQAYAFNRKNAAVEINVADRFIDWARKGTDRFTDESHRSRNLGDRFLRYVAQMAERSIFWGSEKDAPPFRY